MASGESKPTVVKLGGSILTSVEAYRSCAGWLHDRLAIEPQRRFVVVVSAQYGQTDELLNLATSLEEEPAPAALDLLWSTGELRSVAILTLCLQQQGVAATGLNAHECGLSSPTGARCASGIQVNTLRVRYWLAAHRVVVVPGFVARGPFDTLVTLGRGGSDLTAVLLAASLGAECELIKDVAGYFDKDPHQFADAHHLPQLDYDEALRMAVEGCDLVQSAAIEAAARTQTPLIVRPLDPSAPQTRVSNRRRAAKSAAG